jgi:hypothetical protein
LPSAEAPVEERRRRNTDLAQIAAMVLATRLLAIHLIWSVWSSSLFLFGGVLHLESATIALAGAAVLMLLDNWQHHAARPVSSRFSGASRLAPAWTATRP